MQLQIYSIQKAVAKRKPAGIKEVGFSWKCFSLRGNGAVSGLSQKRQSSPYICYAFLLILVDKTEDFYLKFPVFLPDNGKNQTKEDLHRKFNAFICAIFIFRRLFHFVV